MTRPTQDTDIGRWFSEHAYRPTGVTHVPAPRPAAPLGAVAVGAHDLEVGSCG